MIGKLKLIVASAALVGLTTAALAKGDHQMSPRKAAMLAKFDANQNGVLDPAEKQQLVEARKAKRAEKRAAMLTKFDANKNGALDPAEKTVMREQRIEKRFAKLDANSDGVITLAEMKAAKHERKGKGKRHK